MARADSAPPRARRLRVGALLQGKLDGTSNACKRVAGRGDGLTAKAQKLTDDARRSVLKQIEEGKVKLAAARQRVDALKTVGSVKYEEAKATLESFWKEAKAVFEKG